MCKRYIANATFSHGVVTMIDASRGIGVHYWNRSQFGGFDFAFAYFKDTNLLRYPDFAAKQKVQVRETLNDKKWQDAEVVQRLPKRNLTFDDVIKHKLTWNDRGRLVSVYCVPDVAGAKPDDTSCEKLAFNIRALFWDYKKSQRCHIRTCSSTSLMASAQPNVKLHQQQQWYPKKQRKPQRKPRAPHGDVTGHASTVV